MKKTGLALILLLMLFSLIFGVQVTKEVKAATTLSSVGILYPTNSTYNPGLLLLSVVGNGICTGGIDYSMTYSVDRTENVSVPIVIQPINMYFQVTIRGSAIIPELPEGSHNITVYEKIEVHASAPFTQWDSNTVYFTVDDGNPPIITNLSLENGTYSQNDLSLNFTVDEPTSWIGYSLDGQANVTVAGNTTLTNLAYKEHNVTVYAQDLAGNLGASQTIYFCINQPEIFPTLPVAAVSGSSAMVVVFAGLLVYFKKRKHTL